MVFSLDGARAVLAVIAAVVGGKALEPSDGDGGFFHAVVDAAALALALLGAHAAADGGECAGEPEDAGGIGGGSALYVFDEGGDVDVYGTALDASGVGAVQTA